MCCRASQCSEVKNLDAAARPCGCLWCSCLHLSHIRNLEGHDFSDLECSILFIASFLLFSEALDILAKLSSFDHLFMNTWIFNVSHLKTLLSVSECFLSAVPVLMNLPVLLFKV